MPELFRIEFRLSNSVQFKASTSGILQYMGVCFLLVVDFVMRGNLAHLYMYVS